MKRLKVKAKTLESIGYDKDSRLLHIWRKDGEADIFTQVPASVFKAFQKASSKDKFIKQQLEGLYLKAA